MRTRAFKSGNSQAVRIPAEIAYADTDADLEITRTGDVITIRPVRSASMRNTLDRMRQIPSEPIGPVERTLTRATPWDE